MSRLKERLEQMRRTGAAVTAATSAIPIAPTAAGGRPWRASRFGGGADETFEQSAAPEPAVGGPAARPTPAASTPMLAGPPASLPPALSRRERFGAVAASPRPAAVNRPTAMPTSAAGGQLAPAPASGEDMPHHQRTLKHCLWMFSMTPGRECDRELVLHAAAWYERNQPWVLSGVTAMVQRALDEQQQIAREGSATVRPQSAAAVPSQPAANQANIKEAKERGSSHRAVRYGRQRG